MPLYVLLLLFHLFVPPLTGIDHVSYCMLTFSNRVEFYKMIAAFPNLWYNLQEFQEKSLILEGFSFS